jgi:hypothetical protein
MRPRQQDPEVEMVLNGRWRWHEGHDNPEMLAGLARDIAELIIEGHPAPLDRKKLVAMIMLRVMLQDRSHELWFRYQDYDIEVEITPPFVGEALH